MIPRVQVKQFGTVPTQIGPIHTVKSNDHESKNSHNSDESQDSLPHDGTEIMRNALREPLDELDRRTNKEIQRLVRQKLISDAMNQE